MGPEPGPEGGDGLDDLVNEVPTEGATEAAPAPEPNQDVAGVMADAQAREGMSDYWAAADLYESARVLIDGTEATPDQRWEVYDALGSAYAKAYEIDKEQKNLTAAQKAYADYMRNAGAEDPHIVEARNKRNALKQQIAVKKAEDEDAAEPKQDKKNVKKGLGIGLTFGGIVLVGAGGGMVAAGATARGRAEDEVRETANNPNLEASAFNASQKAFVDEKVKKGRSTLGGGAALAGVGLAALIVGAILWKKSKAAAPAQDKEKAEAMLGPALSPSGGGLVVVGRF
jgi:hypothetical protein